MSDPQETVERLKAKRDAADPESPSIYFSDGGPWDDAITLLLNQLTAVEQEKAEALAQRDELIRRSGNLQHELLDLITLMPDSQTDEIVDYISSLRRTRKRPVPIRQPQRRQRLSGGLRREGTL